MMEQQLPQNAVPQAGGPTGPAPQQQYNPYINAPQQQYNPYVNAPRQQYNPYANAPRQPYNPYMPPYAAYNRPKIVRRTGKTRDLVMAILTLVMCFIMTDCFIWTGKLGMGFAVGAAIFLAAEVWYIAPIIKRKSVYGVACILLYMAGCVSLIFCADGFLKFFTFLCLMLLTTCLLMESTELRAWEPGTFRAIGDYFYVAYAASFGKIASGMYGLFHLEKKESKKKKGIGKAVLGLIVALPLVALLVFLLYNGDEAFRGMLDGIDFGKVPQRLLSIVLAIPVFIVLFSRLFGLVEIKREPRKESGKGLDPTALGFFLLGVSIVYLAYLFSQLAYFFNGFMGFLPEDFTYAQYARRGFFELMTVSFINIVTVILSAAFCRKKDGKLPIGVKLALLFLCLFSLVLTFTEVAKMKMYMDSYGLTRLRILTTLFTVFLALIFITLIVRLFVRKTPYMKIAVVIGAAMVIALSFINIDGVISRYNVDAYRSGKLETVDVRAITWLNDAAVPSLIELAKDEDPEISEPAAAELYRRWDRLHEYHLWDYYWGNYDFDRKIGELKEYDWRGFDITSYQAYNLLLENEDMILKANNK